MLRLRPLILATVALAALPAPALAAKEVVYDVTFEGSGSFSHTKHTVDDIDGDTWTHSIDFSYDLSGTFDDLVFRDGHLVEEHDGDNSGLGHISLKAEAKTDTTNERGGLHEKCTATGSGMTLPEIETDILQPLEDVEPLILRPTDDLPATWECSGDSVGTEEGLLGIPLDLGEAATDAEFVLPREIIGHGKIIQIVDGPPEHAEEQCPTQDDRSTVCTGGWHGTVTFTKVAERTVDERPAPQPQPQPKGDLLAPLVPHKDGKPAPQADADDLLAPLVVPKSASTNGKTVSFNASCSGGCAGTATFTAAGGARAAAVKRALATVRFRVKRGQKAVRLTLPAKARKALKRTKRLTMKVALKRGATVRTTTIALRLR